MEYWTHIADRDAWEVEPLLDEVEHHSTPAPGLMYRGMVWHAGLPPLEPGMQIDVPMSSFTTSAKTAEEFSWDECVIEDEDADYAVTFTVDGFRGVAIDDLGWGQSEWVGAGTLTVISVTPNPDDDHTLAVHATWDVARHTEPYRPAAGTRIYPVAPTPITDSWGNTEEYHPGQLSERNMWLMKNGQCLAMAEALSERFATTDVWIDSFPDYDDPNERAIAHAYACTPDGDLFDVSGPADLIVATEIAMDRDPDATVERMLLTEAIRRFAPHMQPQNVEFARSLVSPLMRSHGLHTAGDDG